MRWRKSGMVFGTGGLNSGRRGPAEREGPVEFQCRFTRGTSAIYTWIFNGAIADILHLAA